MRSCSIALTALIATPLASMLVAAPVQAQVNRTFVSTAGSDSNNCANVATPCRHFQAAVTATAPGGEIVALDPGNYGSMTIQHQITINGLGWAYVAPPTGGNAITINASAGDKVTLNGVVLDGVGITGGTNGIVFNSGGGLTVTNCTLQNFVGSNPISGSGILMQPSSGTLNFTINSTTASNNSTFGIGYFPTGGTPNANGVIDHVVANADGTGIFIFTGGAMGGATVVSVSNSITSNNATGVFVQNGSNAINASIDNVNASGNGIGVDVAGTAKVVLGRSVITGNTTGIDNSTQANTFYTYKDNRIDLNVNDFDSGGFPLNTTRAQQ